MTLPQSFDASQIDKLFRRVDRPLWLVTAAHEGRRGGLVATYVVQASIDRDRPLAVVGLAPNHHTAELVRRSGACGLHLVGRQHLELVWRLALGSGRDVDKLDGCRLRDAAQAAGPPLLANCLGWLDARVVDCHDIGDRLFFICEIVAGSSLADGDLLTERDLIAAATPEQLAALRLARSRPAIPTAATGRLA